VDLGLDPVLTAMTISLHDMNLDLSRFEAKHLVSDAPDAEKHLQRFIEGWLVNWVSEEIEQVSLFNTQFAAFGAIARADQIQWKKNHLILLASLYDEDDPAVDKKAPDTEINRLNTHEDTGSIHVAFSGLDDRDGALGYSYRLNGGSWSGWTTDTEVTLSDLIPGDHLFEVKARDSWLNEDNSPANIHFELGPPEADDTDNSALANCSCSSNPDGSRGLLGIWTVAGLVFLARRRRE
jgi:MYXO-CTERM domain-containing protein